jgi:undecaprenyl-diphosphatase
MIDTLLQLDRELFFFLNGLNTSWLDPIVLFITGKFTFVPLYVFLLYISIRRFGWRAIVLFLFIAVLITLTDQTTNIMKAYFQRFRPSRDESLEGLIHLVNNYKGGGRFGFASAHAANSFALAVFIARIFRQNVPYIAPIMFTYAVLHTYSRVYLGVHYPGDVIVGALLGVAYGWALYEIWRSVQPRIFKKAEKLIVSS